MKLKYILLSTFSYILLVGNIACSDENIYIPDPVEKTEGHDGDDEDDGFVSETTTDAIFKVSFDMAEKENVYQEIDGFGCAFAEWSHRIFNHTQREKVLTELFGESGLELNFMRGEVFPHYKFDATTEVGDFGMDRDYTIRPDDPYLLEGYWDKVEEAVQLGQMWLTDQLKRRYPKTRFLYSTWSPPVALKTTGNVNNGKLKTDKYQVFADHLVKFVQDYEQKFGTVPYAISPTNEPNAILATWSACSWTGPEVAKFVIENLRPSLNNAGYSDVKIMFGEHSWWSSGHTFFQNATKSYPEIKDMNIIQAAHGYFTNDGAITAHTAAEEVGVKVWNTETSNTSTYDGSWADAMTWANTFHLYMARANLSAFIWWAGARPCTNNESLIVLEEALPSTTYWKPLRYYTFGHFTKHIKPGSWRVGIEKLSEEGESQTVMNGINVSAYINEEEGRFTIVAVNPNKDKSLETIVEIDGYEIVNMQLYASTEDAQWVKSKINPSEETRTRYVTIPEYSTVTITGKIKPISE